MKIIITRSVFIRGVLVEASPDPVDVLEADAKQLLNLGKAVPVPNSPAPVAVETTAPELSAPVDAAPGDKSKKK